jgi:hypothetical protein
MCSVELLIQTVCLLVHKTLLNKIPGGKTLDQLREEVLSCNVTASQIEAEYMTKVKWDDTRKHVVDETLHRLGLK